MSLYKKDFRLFRVCPEEDSQDVERSQGQGLGEAADVIWFVHLEQRKLRGELIIVYSFFQEAAEGEKEKYFREKK